MPRKTPSSTPKTTRARRHIKGMVCLLLLAGGIAATGCGETSSTTTSAAAQGSTSTPAEQTTTAASTQAASTPSPEASQPKGPASKQSGPAKAGRSRAHLVLPPAGAQPEPKPTSRQLAHTAVADISLSSPAITLGHTSSTYTLSRTYTCNGTGHSPPLHWTGLPKGTQELALFVMSTVPVGGKLYFDWAVAGLNPKLTGLTAGVLPSGAVVGRNGKGQTSYTICPTAGKHESYVFLLYALPQKLSPSQGFDPATLRKEAMQIARHSGLLVGTYG